MQNLKETSTNIQDLLTVCLAKAFQESLLIQIGPDWFQGLKNEEAEETYPIVKEYQRSIKDCDFQALLKILYYRSKYAQLVLSYYGQEDQVMLSGNRQTPFQRTLGRLINDYRNNIAAHVSVEKS